MSFYQKIRDHIQREEMVSRATVVHAPDGTNIGAEMLVYPDGVTDGSLGNALLDAETIKNAVPLMQRTGSKTFPITTDLGDFEVFVDVFPPPPTLLVFGAVHISIPLVKMAKELGFRVKVIDGREKFLTKERFPEADELIFAWPDEAVEQLKIDHNTYIVILSHDEKFDEPALQSTLPSQARYIGAIGSRTTVAKRVDRLKKLGITEEQMSKIHGPVGIEIGAKEPAEIAVSILAEIIGVKYGVVK
ncbi:MAG: XdhC family protein [Chloroflexi bacterium]|uniref:XdhC family protein n=1 Tax=Candidatus Chlorohelix allophototropha TaxID=3003348 RepID=A0A8T7M2P7_9CHLR|nr:XdhC family protein [Chloroflexota bacterium]WJW65732.1 XdhC/CoxI family protein [Chloroflexota bacterium L227-S17]